VGLRVHTERMWANLDATGALIYAEAVSTALARATRRAAAHELVEGACRPARGRSPFAGGRPERRGNHRAFIRRSTELAVRPADARSCCGSPRRSGSRGCVERHLILATEGVSCLSRS
jgi:hypothetical protein